MNLEQTLRTVTTRIASGDLANEAQVKHAVVLPVLRELGWDDSDPSVLRPEYALDTGFVDYALLDRGRPLIFIEAKKVGALSVAGEAQLFWYATNKGVPVLILTDGNLWDFYLSMAAGPPDERRFYRMNFGLEHKLPEHMNFLEVHLHRERVVSGEARKNSEQLHETNRKKDHAYRIITTSWKLLLSEPDELLRDLLMEKVESECGTRPEQQDIEEFLKEYANVVVETPTAPRAVRSRKKRDVTPEPAVGRSGKLVGFVYRGETNHVGTAIGTLVAVLTALMQDDSEFIERFSHTTITRARNLVAKDQSNLYRAAHLADMVKKLPNGWWLGSNLSEEQIRRYIGVACDVAGVKLGVQLKLLEE